MATITLENMEFHAHHGCMDHEKTLGNTFYVTVKMKLDTIKAEKSDDLNDTLNYQNVYDVVKIEMSQPSNLIEHVAHRIIDSLQSNFNQLESIYVKLTKMNPPLGAKVPSVSIEIEKTS